MRENIEMLEKREKFLQTKIDKEIETARANAQKNKKGNGGEGALSCVRHG